MTFKTYWQVLTKIAMLIHLIVLHLLLWIWCKQEAHWMEGCRKIWRLQHIYKLPEGLLITLIVIPMNLCIMRVFFSLQLTAAHFTSHYQCKIPINLFSLQYPIWTFTISSTTKNFKSFYKKWTIIHSWVS